MTRFPRRGAPAVLVALVVLSACALVTTVAVQRVVGWTPLVDPGAVLGALRAARWTDPAVVAAASVCVLVGAGLLLCALLPGTPTVLPLRDDDPRIDRAVRSGATRKSVRRVLRSAASSVDGVASVRLLLTGRAVTATATTHRAITDGLADAVRAAIEDRLDRIGQAGRPAVGVRIRRRGR
ncbi:DUF6286 domain-containing protein [Actinokineospora auranticolor]|uniref:DUF6286 domain-containing protein n=1 Tax=Actinokineospora auranticolor TaxID=155976 RepID=A0A2S6GIP6_9PSEU|nr:DUF6286 domain-containing protein [Actinokineospora auranticolor]PPK65104.1 hypothetical protein CLV40_116147 [Actinokineospora auranticolor]